jgi:hypothetical protein
MTKGHNAVKKLMTRGYYSSSLMLEEYHAIVPYVKQGQPYISSTVLLHNTELIPTQLGVTPYNRRESHNLGLFAGSIDEMARYLYNRSAYTRAR